jgi:molybdopterin adenylyltransferase
MQPIKILSVNKSEKTGTIKKPVAQIELTPEGVEGDAHAGNWQRQVSLLGNESIEKFIKEVGHKVNFGEFAENITTSGAELYKFHPLDRLISGDIILEVTQIGKECHGTSCAIFKEVGDCVMPKEGIFCRVIKPGILKAGIEFTYKPKICTIHIITLSDRASHGEYEDKSGPRIKELIEQYFQIVNYQFSIVNSLLPDDPEKLKDLLLKSKKDKTDLIFTTGGTGIGPRDFTPDVVKPLLDKEIPGIMEMIRLKYGAEKPNALISRSIAGVMDQSLIFTFPGSVKAINEYMDVITKSLMHMIYMLHGLDSH